MTEKTRPYRRRMTIGLTVALLISGSAGCRQEPAGHAAEGSLQPGEAVPSAKPGEGEPSKVTKIPMH